MGGDTESNVTPVDSTPYVLSPYQVDFIEFLLSRNVLKIAPPGEFFSLKSKRRSKTFLNFGDVSDGVAIEKLGEVFAQAIVASDIFPDTILGPAYKGIPIAVATATALSKKPGFEKVGFTFDRKEEKLHGEVTGSKEDFAKKMFVGRVPKDSMKVLYVDDVVTTGGTKVEEDVKVKSAANIEVVGLLVGGNRQELDEEGVDAVASLEEKLGIKVTSILNVVSDVIPYLLSKGKISPQIKKEHDAYVRTYGVESVKKWCRDLKFIEKDKGLIPACDVPYGTFVELVKATANVPQITAYKIGFEALLGGLDKWVACVRQYAPGKKVIYDHQKAGTDIPDTGRRYMEIMKSAGVDAVILFPQSGRATQWEWTHSAFEQGLEVIVGGEMTHKNYKASEGGYISDEALDRIYVLAAKSGVNNFVMPGNKPDRIEHYKKIILEAVPGIKPMIYSPGLVAQGGKIEAGAAAAGDRWQAIVGRGIYGDIAKQGHYNINTAMHAAAVEHASQLV